MSVAVTFRHEIRPWRGYDDPALPAGSWVAQGTAAGDASGGTITVAILFQLSAEELSSRMFNLEQLTVRSESATGLHVQITNMGRLSQARLMAVQTFGAAMTERITGVTVLDANVLSRPLWIGEAVAAGQVGSIDFLINNGAGQSLTLTCQGYMWEPRSILAPGGPQRPLLAPWG